MPLPDTNTARRGRHPRFLTVSQEHVYNGGMKADVPGQTPNGESNGSTKLLTHTGDYAIFIGENEESVSLVCLPESIALHRRVR